MRRAIMGMLLASVAVPAFAADMPVKAPYAAQFTDWSGVYVGGAIGGAWGREKLDQNVTTFDDPTLISSQLFGTSAARILDGNPTLIAPPFVMSTCLLSNCNTIKMSGIMAGGFAGVQKQWGNWVIGLEGSWDWLSLKKTLSASEVDKELVNRFVIGAGGLPVLQSPQPTAIVTRTASATAKIDEVADIRSKVGVTNTFLGPNFLLYATGGASIAHIQHSLTLTQNVQRLDANGAPINAPRFNEFDAVSGDTRLGWVVGAGLDWKPVPNLVLGVLYRHHEFPKGTVAFNDGTNSLGFGTSRVSLDSVQGRASILFPIH